MYIEYVLELDNKCHNILDLNQGKCHTKVSQIMSFIK